MATFSRVNIIVTFSHLVSSSCFLGRLPYSFQVVDQDRRYHMLKIARLIFPCLSAVQCSINDTSHALASRTGILSLEPPYKLERRSPSCTKERPRSVDISMKTKYLSLLPSSHLYSTSIALCRQSCLFILPIAPLPCVLDNVQNSTLAPHGPCSWFLGRYP